jgi:hypothetical protein
MPPQWFLSMVIVFVIGQIYNRQGNSQTLLAGMVLRGSFPHQTLLLPAASLMKMLRCN